MLLSAIFSDGTFASSKKKKFNRAALAALITQIMSNVCMYIRDSVKQSESQKCIIRGCEFNYWNYSVFNYLFPIFKVSLKKSQRKRQCFCVILVCESKFQTLESGCISRYYYSLQFSQEPYSSPLQALLGNKSFFSNNNKKDDP